MILLRLLPVLINIIKRAEEKSKRSGVDCGIKQHVNGLVRLTSDYGSNFNGRSLQPKLQPQLHRVTSIYATTNEIGDRQGV